MTQAPGRVFIIVTGIFYIILGVLGMILVLNTIVFGLLETNIVHDVVIFAQSCLFLFTGIVGIKHCNSVSEASFLKKLALVNIAAALAMSAFTFAILPQLVTALYELFSGLALGILFLVGASKNEAANLKT